MPRASHRPASAAASGLEALGSLAGGLLAPALAQFMRTNPAIDCTPRSDDREFLLALLLDGIMELTMIAWASGGSLGAQLTPLFLFREPAVLGTRN